MVRHLTVALYTFCLMSNVCWLVGVCEEGMIYNDDDYSKQQKPLKISVTCTIIM